MRPSTGSSPRRSVSPLDDTELSPEQRERGRRFAEVIDMALRRMSDKIGTAIGAQTELARLLDASTTMIHRYKTGRTDFANIKVASLAKLAEVTEMDVGTIYRWVYEGRESANAFERKIRGRPVTFGAEELYRELGAALKLRGPEEPSPPRLHCEEILDALDLQRSSNRGLFDRLAEMVDGEGLTEALEASPRDLTDNQWTALATLLDSTEEKLKQTYIR